MTIYYVDTGSTGTGDGTTTATTGANAAFKTIAEVNAKSFSVGDSCLFNKGQTWREQLTVPSSGSAGNPITFGAYGSGENPIISGANAPTGFATANATITKTWSTWTNSVVGENLVDAGNTGNIAYAVDTGAAKFTSTYNGLSNTQERARQADGDTWEAWGIPVGSTMVSAQLTAFKRKIASTTGITSHNLGIGIYDSAGTTTVHSASSNLVDSSTLSLTPDADFVVVGSNTARAIDATYQASNTVVKLRLAYTASSSGTTATDFRLDDVVIALIYNSPTIWDKAVTTQPYLVKVGATAPKPMSASRNALVAAGDWYWAGNVLSVYAAADPSGTVEVGTRNRVIDTNNETYLTFDGLTLRHGNEKDVGVSLGSTTVTGIIFQNCTIEENAKRGIDCKGSSAADSVTINNCIVRNNGGWGIYISNNYTAGTISNCTVYGNGWYSYADSQQYGGIQGYLGNFNIYGNTIYSNVEGTASSAYESHGIYYLASTVVSNIYQNTVYSHRNGSGMRIFGSANVYQNKIYDNDRSGINIGSNGVVNVVQSFSHNIIYSNDNDDTSSGITEDSKGAGTISLSIYNNVFYKNGSTSQQELRIADDLTVFNLKNNVFVATDTRRTVSVVAQTGTVSIDNNLHWRADGNPAIYYAGTEHTWGEWQGHGYDQAGVNANPLFVNAAGGDFRLQAGSPCIDAGVDVGLTEDYAGNPVPH